MKLKGSCQCGKVSFTVDSKTPYPFNYCYCTICRKLCGGVVACNIMGERKTLKVKGEKYLKLYHATMREKGKRTYKSKGERWFCRECGSHLWVMDDEWPDGVWPNAGVIDTELPVAPEHVHLMLDFKAKWVPVFGKGRKFKRYPKESIQEWHERRKLLRP